MSNFPPNISEHSAVTAEALEMRHCLSEMVDARRPLGLKRAIHETAREYDLSPRRVMGIIRGEVSRVWADELARVRNGHAKFLDREAARAEHRAAILRARRLAIQETPSA